VLKSNKCLMRARTAALRPSPPQVYQEMISLAMEKLGVAREISSFAGGQLESCGHLFSQE